MKINGIQNQNSSVFKTKPNLNFSKGGDSLEESLKKQIMNIHKKISSISDNESMSLEQKKELRDALTEQLKELNQQLIERDLEIKKEQEQKQAEKIKEQNSFGYKREDSVEETTNLISVTTSLNRIKKQNSVNVKMKGEAMVLDSEIKLDQSRGIDVSEKREQLHELKGRIKNLTKKIDATMEDVNKEFKKDKKKPEGKDINVKHNNRYDNTYRDEKAVKNKNEQVEKIDDKMEVIKQDGTANGSV